eukprot:425684_1
MQRRNKSELTESLLSQDISEGAQKPTRVNDPTANENKSKPQHIDTPTISKVSWYLNWKTWIKIFILICVIVFLVIAIIYKDKTKKYLTDFLNWMQRNVVLGAFAFIGLYWFCTVFMIPGSILTLGAGFVFRKAIANQWVSIFIATIIVWTGATIGAITAFILGRFVLRAKVASYKEKYEKFDIVDQVVEQNGLKVTLLLRLSPIIPFNLFNYFMGLTSVTFRAYSIACIGMLPGTLAYCFIGGTLSALTDAGSIGLKNPTVLIFTIVGTVVALIGMIYIGYVAKKEFNKLANQIKENQSYELANTNDNENEESEDLKYLQEDPQYKM